MKKEFNISIKVAAIATLEAGNAGRPSRESAMLFREVVNDLRGGVSSDDLAEVTSLHNAAGEAAHVVERAVNIARLEDAMDAVGGMRAFALTRTARRGMKTAWTLLARQRAAAWDAEDAVV